MIKSPNWTNDIDAEPVQQESKGAPDEFFLVINHQQPSQEQYTFAPKSSQFEPANELPNHHPHLPTASSLAVGNPLFVSLITFASSDPGL